MLDSIIGQQKNEIATPALVIDLDIFESNLKKMGELTAHSNIAYRPHSKSHKQPIIAHKQLRAGAIGICCSKLSEAEVMVAGGIHDILITSPVVAESKVRALAALARHARLAVVVDSKKNVAALNAAAQNMGSRLGSFVEIDVGQGRCGVVSAHEAVELAIEIERARGLEFRGLQGYQGRIQLESSIEIRRTGAQTALSRLQEVAQTVRRAGIQAPTLTGGGTGTLAIDIVLGGLNELQPGSYVFMDSRYTAIEWDGGGRPPFQSSLSVLAGVISRPLRNRVVLDSGWKAISNDAGNPVLIAPEGAKFRFAGDEHAVLEHDDELPLAVGDTVQLIPSHCDTTINLYDHCYALRSGRVEAIWPIPGRGKLW